MTIRFLCPSGHRLSVPDGNAGQLVSCARCKKTVNVPGPSEDKPSGQPPSQREPEAQDSIAPKTGPPPLPPGPMPAVVHLPAAVCLPDRGRVATVGWLALVLALVVAYSLCPVVYKMYLNVEAAPGWARIVLLLAAVQVVYIVWMVNAPDWASVWVVMLVFAAVAAIYGTATAMAIATPVEEPMPLGMGEVRHSAKFWCTSVLLAMSLATYFCGRTSTKWRRAFELETADRGGARR